MYTDVVDEVAIILVAEADKVGTTVEKHIRSLAAAAARRRAAQDARRATTDDRDAIDSVLKGMNGNIPADFSVLDVVGRAGVQPKQGVKKYARNALANARLTHKKAA